MSVFEYLSVPAAASKLFFEGHVYNFMLDACCSRGACVVRIFRWNVEFVAGSLKSLHKSQIQNVNPLSMIDFEKGLSVCVHRSARLQRWSALTRTCRMFEYLEMKIHAGSDLRKNTRLSYTIIEHDRR